MWNFRLSSDVLWGRLGDGRAGLLTSCSGFTWHSPASRRTGPTKNICFYYYQTYKKSSRALSASVKSSFLTTMHHRGPLYIGRVSLFGIFGILRHPIYPSLIMGHEKCVVWLITCFWRPCLGWGHTGPIHPPNIQLFKNCPGICFYATRLQGNQGSLLFSSCQSSICYRILTAEMQGKNGSWIGKRSHWEFNAISGWSIQKAVEIQNSYWSSWYSSACTPLSRNDPRQWCCWSSLR